MKKTITTLASLAIAASAAAHTTAVPHSHAPVELNWLAIIAGTTTFAIAAITYATIRKNGNRAK